MLSCFFGSIAFLYLTVPAIKRKAVQFFMKVLPDDKFPQGSSFREAKAEVSGDKLFKLLVYTLKTVALYIILKDSPFLHKMMFGSME